MIATETVAIAWAISATGLGIILERICDFRIKRLQAALAEMKESRDSWHGFYEEAQTNAEAFRIRSNADRDVAKKLGLRLFDVQCQLDQIARAHEESAETRRAHMRRIGLAGNKSEKRRAQSRHKAMN